MSVLKIWTYFITGITPHPIGLEPILAIMSVSTFKAVDILYVFTCFLIIDVGYLDNDSYKVLQPTAWIPLIDTNEKNGCLQVSMRITLR